MKSLFLKRFEVGYKVDNLKDHVAEIKNEEGNGKRCGILLIINQVKENNPDKEEQFHYCDQEIGIDEPDEFFPGRADDKIITGECYSDKKHEQIGQYGSNETCRRKNPGSGANDPEED